jgi:DNA-binding NarL/FixJ family response regulator
MPAGPGAFRALPGYLQNLVPLLAEGKTNDEIATSLVLALHTVEGYVSELKQHIGARDRVQLVDICRQLIA